MMIHEVLKEDEYSVRQLTGTEPSVSGERLNYAIAKKVASFMQKHCATWLSQTQNGKLIAYRGFAHAAKRQYPEVFLKKVRDQRNPRNSIPNLHDFLNLGIEICGRVANRTNSVFVSSSIDMAEYYGEAYIVAPVGDFHYTWDEGMFDWFELTDRETYEAYKTYRYGVLEPGAQKEKMKRAMCPSMRGDDGTLEEALQTGHEVMISSEEIIAIHPPLYRDYVLPFLTEGFVR